MRQNFLAENSLELINLPIRWKITTDFPQLTIHKPLPTIKNQTLRMKKLNLFFTFFLGMIILSCSSDGENNNTIVDLSQFEDYKLEYSVVTSGVSLNEESYEYQVTIITTDENNQIVEMTETLSGEVIGTLDILTVELVKEYKIIGVRVDAVSDNVFSLSATLKRASDQNEVMNAYIIIPSSATITYDFETGIETITSE